MLTGSKAELEAYRQGEFLPKFFLFFAIYCALFFFLLILAPVVALPLAWVTASWRSRVIASRKHRVMMGLQEHMLKELLGDPKLPAYFCCNFVATPCAIAADATSGQVHIVKWAAPENLDQFEALIDGCLRKSTFDAGELLQWEALDPGVTQARVIGSARHLSPSDVLAIQRDNAAALAQQQRNTGLRINTSRLHEQEAFLNLYYSSANQWVLLLKKLTDGDLPRLHVATEFPLQ